MHAYARGADGSVWAAGSNSNGQLGLGSKTKEYWTKTSLSDIRFISGGTNNGYAVGNDGSIWSVGYGPLGLGDIAQRIVWTLNELDPFAE